MALNTMAPASTLQNRQIDKMHQQDKRLLRIYNYYRVFLSILLIMPYFLNAGKVLFGMENPAIFLITSASYALINLGLLILLRGDLTLNSQQIVGTILIDIVALALMTYATGGSTSGLDNLMIFSVAAGSILLAGRYALFFAAIASISVILVELYRLFVDSGSGQQYIQAGVLGIIFFATAIFVKQLSRRISISESLAQSHATNVVQLEKLNRLIIQRMRTGILVCSQAGEIRMMNDAARLLLSDNPGAAANRKDQFQQLPEPLLVRLEQWQQNPQSGNNPFQAHASGPMVQANFTSLREEENFDVLVFLEDSTQLMQQAQQLKLASLGQLTASIAHEIRNPLGAISHAAQLMKEIPDLGMSQERLVTIIHDHAKRMNMTIENILELSRRRTPEPEVIPLADWLNEFIVNYNNAEQRTGQFSVEINPADLSVKMDPTQLAQVVTNLCSNGLLFSEQETGKATLTFRAGIAEKTELPYLDIMDQGPGVPSDRVSRLFEPFFTTRTKGTGLGLYISKELCEANNARLEHIATYTDGCCFRIIFPHPKKLEPETET